MRNPVHLMVQQLTGKQTLEDCSLEEIRRIVQRYPYYAPAQFLLLQKLRQSGTAEEADAQHKKAVLYYPDPLAFEVFISSEKFYVSDDELPATTDSVFTGEEPEQEFSQIESDLSTQLETIEVHSASVEYPVENGIEKDRLENVSDADATDVEVTNGEMRSANVAIAYKPEDISLSIEEEPQPILPATTGVPAVDAVTFEPFHTVDYFASQGIKISQDEVPKDKLGKQLKSFTEWLKTMKRLPATELKEGTENGAEKSVEGVATRSLSSSEVLTEAMAEVWAKQGVPQKALDIYNKLSLHNPSKRDYFAAKIENLKQS